MPELATDDYVNVPIPRRLKISSKRQITIPVDVYERHGFADYALFVETEEGFEIRPVQIDDGDEQLTLLLLHYLVDRGFEGEELIEKFAELKPSFFSFHKAIQRSEEDIVAGRVRNAKESLAEIRAAYGL